MTQYSREIFIFLSGRTDPVKNPDLANYLGLKDDRELQGSGEDVGILETAREEIYKAHKKFLCTNFSGSKILNTPDEAEEYMKQVWVRAARAFDSLNAMKNRIRSARAGAVVQEVLDLIK